MSAQAFNIQFDQSPSGRWFYVSAEGVRHDHVLAVRSFPVAAPDEGVALVDVDGKELLLIPHLGHIREHARHNIQQAIKQLEFNQQILNLYGFLF